MNAALACLFHHMLTVSGFDTSLGSAKNYFKTLTPDAVMHIVKSAVPGDMNPQEVYNKLDETIAALVWRHGPYWTVYQYMPPKVLEVDMGKKKKVAHFRIIGDVHGKYDRYAHVASEAHNSLQVGDMGFDYRYLTRVVDSEKHRIIGGNHDNYTKHTCPCGREEDCKFCNGKGYTYGDQSKHFLGDYGIWSPPDFESIFYIRGAWSIDWQYRTPEVSWWEDEEIPYPQMLKALEGYKVAKPEFVVSHTAPYSIVPSIPFEKIFGETIHKPRTEILLDEMYEVHQPRIWLFGHWHVDWDKVMKHPRTGKETRFICLAELSYKDFPKLGEEADGNK